MTAGRPTRLALIASQAFSIPNFRGPLIRSMVDTGIEVLALAPDYGDAIRADVRSLGAEPVDFSLSRAGMNPFSDLRGLVDLVSILRRRRVDVTLSCFVKSVVYGTLAAWIARVPRRFALITGLGYAFTPSSAVEPLSRRLLRRLVMELYRAALSRANLTFFQNDDDLQLFVRRRLVSADRSLRVNGTGVDLAHWAPVAPATEPVTFLLAARLLREKGIGEFVSAARNVKVRAPGARFVLLGDLDPNPGSFSRGEVESWVAEGLVEWPGHVPVRPWLARTSVYVLPSYYREGVPRSTQEALAMARPVITTDAPGCRDTVVDGESGFLVPVRDVNALTAAMLRFIDDPSLIGSMGASARRLAETRFDVHAINDVMLGAMDLLPASGR